MWRKVPLNAKLITSLLFVQAATLLAGALWLTSWIEKARLDDLKHRLDTQGDAIEDAAVQHADGSVAFDTASEMVRELAEDRDFYFTIRGKDGRALVEAGGPAADTKRELRGAVREDDPERFYIVTLPSGAWLVQSEPHMGGHAHFATNAQPVLSEVAALKRYISIAVLGILVATSLGSWIVVSFSTRNLRLFAHQIREVDPVTSVGTFDLNPLSAEEALLFDSYHQMLRTVRASSEAQRLFLANASHELKTPIAASLSALQVTLARPRTAADYEQTCRDVLAETLTLRRLSTTLLDLARLESGIDQNVREACDVSSTVHRVMERWQKAAAGKRISMSLSGTSGALIRGTAEQWEVVVGNLLDNAVKYGRTGGRVTLKVVVQAESTIEITVVDDGVGMTSEQLARLGDVFFRADTSRTGGESFGLGFAHAKRIVEMLGGKVGAQSILGAGTTITVSAPTA